MAVDYKMDVAPAEHDAGQAGAYRPNRGIGSPMYDRLCAEEVQREAGRLSHDAGRFRDFRGSDLLGTP